MACGPLLRNIVRTAGKWVGIALMFMIVLILAQGLVDMATKSTQNREIRDKVLDVLKNESAVESTASIAEDMSFLPQREVSGEWVVGRVLASAAGLDFPVSAPADNVEGLLPCQVVVSDHTECLVVFGMPYQEFFRDISTLANRDTITFTQMDGAIRKYVVSSTGTSYGTIDSLCNNNDAVFYWTDMLGAAHWVAYKEMVNR